MISILDDHPGTRPETAQVRGREVRVQMRREPMTRADWTTHDYNVHFCVGLENRGDQSELLELSVEGGRWEDLPENAPLLYAATAPTGPFHRADLAARTDLSRRYAVRVSIAAGARLYVANTLVRCPGILSKEFEELGALGGAERRVIGRSCQGREIVAYCYGRGAGGLLVTSGFHPPEPDTLATAEIMRYLSQPEGRELSSRLPIVIVPIANPDGYALGTQGANAEGINFYWNFAREEPARCPEAVALWRLAETMAPRGYIDFHCYTFQLKKRPGPYIRPLLFYSGAAVRAAAQELYRRLAEDRQSASMTGFGTFAPHTLGAMLAQRFDTLALAKYHLHLAEGEQACRARGLSVFVTVAATLLAHNLLGPASPGSLRWRAPVRAGLIYWAGLLRPALGRLRRGQFDRVQFERTAQVSPGRGVADEIA